MRETIWYKDYQLPDIQRICHGNMLEHLGIELTRLSEDSLTGTMPVDHRTVQPAGLLHGGASVALAESLGSIAASLCVDPERWVCVGQEVNASHLRPVRDGRVTATAKPVYRGRSSQVWEIDVEDERQRRVCRVRLTVAVVSASHGGGHVGVF